MDDDDDLCLSDAALVALRDLAQQNGLSTVSSDADLVLCLTCDFVAVSIVAFFADHSRS